MALLFLVALVCGQSASASTLYWDTNGTVAGAGVTPSGIWTTGTNTFGWNTDSNGIASPVAWNNNSDAIFSSGSDATNLATITMGSTIMATSLTFEEGAYNFTSGNMLSLIPAAAGGTILTMNAGAGAVTFNGNIQFGTNTSLNVNFNFANNSNSLLTFAGAVFNDNNSGTGGPETIVLTGTGKGGVTFSGVIADNAAGATSTNRPTALTVNTTGAGAAAVTTLSGANAYSGGTTITSGILRLSGSGTLGTAGANAANGALDMGSAGQLDLNGVSVSVGNFSGTAGALIYNNNAATARILSIGSGNGGGGIFAGTIGDNTGSGGTIGLLKMGTGTITLTGSNGYTGATTINGGTLTISGPGSINNSSGYTITGGTLTLDNSTGVANRLNDTNAVTLSTGGALNLFGNGANASVTENVGTLGIAGGQNIVTLNGIGVGQLVTLAASSFARTNNATALIRGNALQTAATNATRLTVDGINGSGLTFVGADTSAVGVSTSGSDTAIRIIPYFIGDTTSSGAGSSFVTYDVAANGGLRVLAASEYATLSTTYATPANAENAKAFNGVISSGSNVILNSLLFSSSGQTLDGSGGVLVVNSGAVAATANAEMIGSGFSGLTLGNGIWNEGIITISGNTLTIATPITVSGNGGLTKAGTGTLLLTNANFYSGATNVNQGTLQIGNATTAGDLGTSSGVNLNGGSITFNRATNPFVYLNAIAGSGTNTGTVTQAGTGALTLGSISNVNTILQSASSGALTTGPLTNIGTLSQTAANSGALTTGNITNVGTIAITSAAGATLGNVTTAAQITRSAGAGALTFGSITGIGTLTDNSTNGSLMPTTVNQSGSGLTIGTINGASGSVIVLQGTGTTTISSLLATAGQTVKFNGGTWTLAATGGFTSKLEVDTGIVQHSTNDFNNLTSLTIHGGQLLISGGNGIHMGNTFAAGSTSSGNFTGIQDGGLLSVTQGSIELGSNTGANAVSYGLTSGTLSSTVNFNIGANMTAGAQTTFSLSGGKFSESATIAGAQGNGALQAFVWTGGTLVANVFNATNLTSSIGTAVGANTNTLTNAGGILAPGDIGTAGKTSITGNYSVTSASALLTVDVGGTAQATAFQTGQYDLLSVTGAVSLAGCLMPALINGFTPDNANSFTILAASAVSGSFTNTVTSSAAPRVTLADGLSSFTVTTRSTSVVLGGFQSNNFYNAPTGATWDAAGAASWTNFDPGATASPTVQASGAIAQFGDGPDTGAGINVLTLNGTRNLQGILFSSGSAGHNYAINNAGSGAIILDNSANNAAATIIDSSADGNANALNLPLTLNGNLNVSVSNANTMLTFGGAIGESGGSRTVTLNGAGTLGLGGSNTYTGVTTIGDTSTLVVNGSLAGGATVGAGATLTGTGSVSGAVVVAGTISGTVGFTGDVSLNSGSRVSGSHSFNTFNLESGAHLALEINGTTAGTGYDQIMTNSATGMSLAGDLSLTIGAFTASPSDVLFLIVNNAGGMGGNLGAFSSVSVTGGTVDFGAGGEGTLVTFNSQQYRLTYLSDADTNSATGGNDVALVAVPEPGTCTMLPGGVALLSFFHRRRRLLLHFLA